MSTVSDFDRLARAWLEDGPTQLSDRTLDAALEEVHLTRQRRALRVPWRYPIMPALSRATGIAAVALVAVVGAGGLIYLNAKDPGGPGGQATASPTPTTAPTAPGTAAPTVGPTPGCSEVAPGICGWKKYTSTVYGYTISYPDDWSVIDRATEKWTPGASTDDPFVDVFFNNAVAPVPDDSMIFAALQVPAPGGADLESWDGLLDAMAEMCAELDALPNSGCSNEDLVTPMCLGSPGCNPVAFVLHDGFPRAVFGDPETGTLTYIVVHRRDDFPGAARYGGTVMLLKSILGQLGVRQPLPAETPN